MKINYNKTLKLITLLISSLLIATASAQIYNYMYQNATIGVEGATLEWTTGDDSTNAGTQISGATCSLTNLKGWTNGTRIYYDPVRLKNIAGSPVTFDLLIDEVSGTPSQMDSIIVRLYSMNQTAYVANLTVWSAASGKGSDLTVLSIPTGHIWKFQWEITWKSTATTETVTVKLIVKTPVA